MKILQNPIVASVIGLTLYVLVTVLVWKTPAPVVEGELAQNVIVAKAKLRASSSRVKTLLCIQFVLGVCGLVFSGLCQIQNCRRVKCPRYWPGGDSSKTEM